LDTLDSLKGGESGVVREINSGRALRRRLLDMGIMPGVEIQVVRCISGKGPRQIALKGYYLALGYGECAKIAVDKVDTLGTLIGENK